MLNYKVGDALSTVKVSILAMVNVGLPKDEPREDTKPYSVTSGNRQ